MRHRYHDFNAARDLEDPSFQLRMHFTNETYIKEAIKNYAIMEGKFKFKFCEPKRVRAKCRTKNYT